MRRTSLILGLILTSTLVHPTAFGGLAQGQTQGPRDTSARTAEAGAPAAIEGRIVAASTGQPLRRARVVATARDFRGRSQPRPMRPGAMSSRIFGRANGVPDGWMLEAVYLGGQDVIDTPLDFEGTRHVEGVRLVLIDQVTQLSGVVHSTMGTARR